MSKEIETKLVGELEELIRLGDKVHDYFLVEKADDLFSEYSYLDEMTEEEFDSEDHELYAKYQKLKNNVDRIIKSSKDLGTVSEAYERFYTPAYRVVATIAPERLSDFESQYKPTKRAKISYANYTIYDGLIGLTTSSGVKPQNALSRIRVQIDILKSIRSNLGSTLFQVEQKMRMELADDELENAEHLMKHGHIRAAGAICGVVLERHLKDVAIGHGFASRKKAPGIADFNDFLKSAEILDTIDWRKIQGLGDLRNLCDHPKDKEPTEEDIEDLLRGVRKVIKTVF